MSKKVRIKPLERPVNRNKLFLRFFLKQSNKLTKNLSFYVEPSHKFVH